MTLHPSWRCLDCEAHGDGPGSDLASRKHEDTTQHGTTTHNRAEPKPLAECIVEFAGQLLDRERRTG